MLTSLTSHSKSICFEPCLKIFIFEFSTLTIVDGTFDSDFPLSTYKSTLSLKYSIALCISSAGVRPDGFALGATIGVSNCLKSLKTPDHREF